MTLISIDICLFVNIKMFAISTIGYSYYCY